MVEQICDNKSSQNRDLIHASKHFDECLYQAWLQWKQQRLFTCRQILFLDACPKPGCNERTETLYIQADTVVEMLAPSLIEKTGTVYMQADNFLSKFASNLCEQEYRKSVLVLASVFSSRHLRLCLYPDQISDANTEAGKRIHSTWDLVSVQLVCSQEEGEDRPHLTCCHCASCYCFRSSSSGQAHPR